MELYKTQARLKRESNDRKVAGIFVTLREAYPRESETTLMRTIAAQKDSPYNSLAGVRHSLIRSRTLRTSR